MELAKQNGVVQGETPVFVKNRLVVIVPRDNLGQVTAFNDLAKPGLKLDLAAPTVPVGNYSRQALRTASAAYGADFEVRALRNVVSEEENVKQVVAKVQLGEADAGMVYISDVTPKIGNNVLMIQIPDAYNQVATYPIALTQSVQNRPAAEAFISFVLSAQGQALLQARVECREPLGDDLWPQGGRSVETVGELLRAGQAQEHSRGQEHKPECAAHGTTLLRQLLDGPRHQQHFFAVHGEVDVLGDVVLVPDHELRQLVLDVALDGAAERAGAGVRFLRRAAQQPLDH